MSRPCACGHLQGFMTRACLPASARRCGHLRALRTRRLRRTARADRFEDTFEVESFDGDEVDAFDDGLRGNADEAHACTETT